MRVAIKVVVFITLLLCPFRSFVLAVPASHSPPLATLGAINLSEQFVFATPDGAWDIQSSSLGLRDGVLSELLTSFGLRVEEEKDNKRREDIFAFSALGKFLESYLLGILF